MDSITNEPERESVLKRIYRDNKGACLILLAEIAASSMDAIVRYLQQGRSHGIPAFQVRITSLSDQGKIIICWLILPEDYFCSHEHDICPEQFVHVVYRGSRFSPWKERRSKPSDSSCFIWLLWTLVLIL